MSEATDLPRPHLRRDGRATLHGTAVERGGRGLLLLGPSGAGKSGLAAEMLMLGARLVADDLLLLEACEGAVWVTAPDAGSDGEPACTDGDARPGPATRPVELRGIGLVEVPATDAAPVRGAVLLAASEERLPEADTMALLGHRIPLVRHPARPGAAAKSLLWLASGAGITASR